jgi:sarcosine oxidase delta subunit
MLQREEEAFELDKSDNTEEAEVIASIEAKAKKKMRIVFLIYYRENRRGFRKDIWRTK